MKRAHPTPSKATQSLEAPGDNNDTATHPATKKQRKARITKNYHIIPLDKETNERFKVNSNIDECIARLKAKDVLAKLRRREYVIKPIIPITTDLSMVVHNVVLTTALYEKAHEKPKVKPPKNEFDYYDISSVDGDDELVHADYAQATRDKSLHPGARADQGDYSDDDDDDDETHAPMSDFRIIQQFSTRDDPMVQFTGDLEVANDMVSAIMDEEQPDDTSKRFYKIPLATLNYYMRHYGTQLNTRRFAAIVLRNDELSSASLIFKSKLVSTGCALLELSVMLMKDALDKIASTGYDDFEPPTPRLRNIVSNGCFPRQICTYMMALMYSDCCRRVARFPAVMIRQKEMQTRAILLFDSGQMSHTGATSLQDIHHDVSLVYPMFINCIKTRQTSKINAECMRLLNLDGELETVKTSMETLREKLFSNIKGRKNAASSAPTL